MLKKTATFNLIEPTPLNIPSMGQSFYLDQKLSLKDNILHDTINNIKTASTIEAEMQIDSDNPDFDLEAEIQAHPDSLFVKCFAIKADETNDNGDYFGKDELKKATSTFVGVPVFTNHQNSDAEEARGKVVYSWWNDERNGIDIIARVDAEAYPKLARGIKEEYIMGTSMGASRGHDLVSMADGSKKRVDELQIGDNVYTHAGAIEKVAAICETQEHNKLYHIKWSSNKNGLALSYEHPVLILKREEAYAISKRGKQYRRTIDYIKNEVKPQFVEASEVKHNDYVLEWIDKSVKKDENINEDIAFLLGVYAAEGYISVDFVEFCFGAKDENISKTIKALSDNFSGKITEINRPERNGYYVRMFSKDLISLCNEYIGTGCKTKRLSNKIKQWDHKLQKIFLGGYLDGDGCLIKERIDKSGHSSGIGAMQASSASLQLLKDMREICLRLGCPATLSSHDRIASKSTVMDQNTQYIEHILSISNTISGKLKKYSYKANSSPEIKKPKFDSFFYRDYIAHRVKEVVVVDNSEPTYYVQIGELDDENSDHSYILNGIATHNCQVAYSLCSICHNKAATPDEYCTCVRERKTRKISGKTKCIYKENGEGDCPLCKSSGKMLEYKDLEVFEYNYGIKFIENSFVVNPACHDCGVTEIIDSQSFLEKVSIITDKARKLVKAAANHDVMCTDKGCIRLAGQQEIDKLNEALESITSVSQSMLQQKDQLDLEFLSDLVSVLSDLQNVTDELTQQGYNRLPSPGETGQTGEMGEQDQQSQQMAPMQPMNPTGSGGSKVHTGPAGEAGNVTSPMASKRLDLTKLSKLLQKKNQSFPKLNNQGKKQLRIGFKIKNN